MQNPLKLIQDEISKLENKIINLENKNAKLKESNDKFKNDNNALRGKLNTALGKIENNGELESLRIQNAQLVVELNKYRRRSREFKRLVDELSKIVNKEEEFF